MVEKLLRELELERIPCLKVFNKVDLVQEQGDALPTGEDGVFISAKDAATLPPLLERAEALLQQVCHPLTSISLYVSDNVDPLLTGFAAGRSKAPLIPKSWLISKSSLIRSLRLSEVFAYPKSSLICEKIGFVSGLQVKGQGPFQNGIFWEVTTDLVALDRGYDCFYS